MRNNQSFFMKECIKNCTDDTGVVCGTNGINFPNICYLEYFICLNPNVKLLYDGECGERFFQAERQSDRKRVRNRQTDKQTNRITDKQTNRQTDKKTKSEKDR